MTVVISDCMVRPANPKLPTVLILGDSHGAHLYPGVKAVFGEKANVLQLDASYCAPLTSARNRMAKESRRFATARVNHWNWNFSRANPFTTTTKSCDLLTP